MNDFYPRNTDSALTAWTAFAAGASAFGAPVPTALLALVPTRAELPSTLDSVHHLLTLAHDEALGDAEVDDLSLIGVQTREQLVELAAAGTIYEPEINPRLLCRVRFGTGRTAAVMDIWTATDDMPMTYWVWAEGVSHGLVREPGAFASLADNLDRRWQAIRAVFPTPIPSDEPIEIIRRPVADCDEE